MEGEQLRGVAGSGGNAHRAAFKVGDAGFQRAGRRVAETGIDVAELLQREEVRGVRRIPEHKAGRLVDRLGARS